MESWKGKIAVVTGASAGIGAAITLDLAKAGMIVVGLARRKERINELASKASNFSGKIHAVECDISNKDSIVETFKWIKEKFGKVHVLVNNAGRLKNGLMTDTSLSHDEYLSTINVNLSGLLVCSREALDLMKAHDDLGYIINVNSVAGHSSPFKFFLIGNIYAPTKHAVTNATEHLRLELATSGLKRIRVSSLSPGYVKTDFQEAAGVVDVMESISEALGAQDVSNAVMYLLSLPSHVNISELTIRPTGERF